MKAIDSVIEALGGPVLVASELGLATSTVGSWGPRGSVPPDLWRDLVNMAARRGVDVTYETLARIHADGSRRKRLRRFPASEAGGRRPSQNDLPSSGETGREHNATSSTQLTEQERST